MSKNILAMVEQHVEKGVLGLTVAGLGLMSWMYLFRSPNIEKFNGKDLGPGELNLAILDSAKQLESAIRNAKAEDPKQGRLDETLLKTHNDGIFAEYVAPSVGAAPAAAAPGAKQDGKPETKPIKLQPVPRVTTGAWRPIEIPGVKATDEAASSVELVTPQAPTTPHVRSGRSLASIQSIKLGEPTKPAGAAAPAAGAEKDAAAEKPREVGWVSIAAYFDRDALRTEMQKNKYSGDRSKVYSAGVQAERQEKLANGEWSEAKLVENSRAMPTLSFPQPAIDEKGALVNKSAIDEAFHIVRTDQTTLLQPPFPPVIEGDAWKLPSIEGFEDEIEDESGSPTPKPTIKPPKERPVRNPRPTGGIGRGGGGLAGGGISGDGGGGRGMPEVGVRGGPGAGAAGSAREKEAQKKQARDDLKAAREHFDKKEWDAARGKAQAVTNNPNASESDKSSATKLIADCEKKLAAAGGAGGDGRVGPRGGGAVSGDFDSPVGRAPIGDMGDPRGAMRGMASPAQPSASAKSDLILKPETNTPAVFFHDDTVDAGKTYRYRMRVNLWNRYVGKVKSLKTPEDARKAIIPGEWSDWSEAVTVTPSTQFFVNSLKPNSDRVSVEVWKWHNGKWIKKNFDVGVGEMIGKPVMVKADDSDLAATDDGKGETKKADKSKMVERDFATGAVVLDVRIDESVKQRQAKGKGGFDYNDRKSLVLVYLDPADGQVKERVQLFDQNDATRKHLKDQDPDKG